MNTLLFKTPEGVVVGFRNIARALPIKKIIGEPPLPPALWHFWAEKGGNFKSCPRVLKLGMRP